MQHAGHNCRAGDEHVPPFPNIRAATMAGGARPQAAWANAVCTSCS
jgi:hypothetical protein